MKNKLPLIFLIILLIIANLFFEFRRGDFSNDPDDKKLSKISKKYEKETNDYNFQIINNILSDVIKYTTDENEEAIKNISDKEISLLNNITDYSIQEIYRLSLENTTINFLKVYVEQNKKLNTIYLQVKQDNKNETYNIFDSNDEEYKKAKDNKINNDTNFTIVENEYNKYTYDYDFTKIAYRYINDYYLKYKYKKKEAYKIDSNYRNYNQYVQNRVKLSEFDYNTVIDEGKSINNDSITYYVQTNTNTFKIKVYSSMNYKIEIE